MRARHAPAQAWEAGAWRGLRLHDGRLRDDADRDEANGCCDDPHALQTNHQISYTLRIIN